MYFSEPVSETGAEDEEVGTGSERGRNEGREHESCGQHLNAPQGVGEDFDPMDWDEVPEEMNKFLAWLNAEMRSGEMASGELAARASHKFNAATQPAAAGLEIRLQYDF
ncbi:hypothetical protein GPALN_010888 [Globodera pallida]|nr:hypothetical protein GPALN_010888 [Globodera pallida]